MKRVITCGVLLACSQPQSSIAQRAASQPGDDARALVAQADALFTEWRPDYGRPFEGEAFSSAERRAHALYLRACNLGHVRACWRAQDDSAMVKYCRAGDALSCHALTVGPPLRVDAPGAAAREDSSDRLALRRECDAGLPLSCSQYLQLDPDAEVLRHLEAIGSAGCRAGVVPDCIALRASSRPDIALFEALQSCTWVGDCERAGLLVAASGDRARARDLFERGCQGWQRLDECGRLGARYIHGELPEPVAGRGRALLDWACTRSDPDRRQSLGCPTTPLSPPVPTTEARALAAAADAYYTEWQPDYARPFNGATDADASDRSNARYRHACQLGDARSCWRYGYDEEIESNCRRGDLTSCHPFGEHAMSDDLPGSAARAYSRSGHHGDAQALRRECDQGLPASCADLLAQEPASPDAPRIRSRFDNLARDGCRAGMFEDCSLLAATLRTREAQLFSAVTYCTWTLSFSACGDAATMLVEQGETIRARDLLEHTCQQGLDPTACVHLGRRYLDYRLPEPITGRGRRLVEWGCAHLDDELAAFADCHVAVKQGATPPARFR